MSSYQFVNTLAQCYAEQQNAAAAGTAGGGHNQQDYYNMNYPNCYSPNLGNNYNQYSLMMSGQAAAAMASMASSAASTDTSTYANNTSLMAEGNSFGVTPKQEQRRSANSPMNNCANKYETGTVGGGGRSVPPGGSPQDLRTSSENEGTPQPKSPSSPSAAGNQPPLSPLLSSTTSQVTSAAAAAAAVAAAAAAASSNTSSNSSNNVSNSGGGGGSGASGNRSSSNKQNSSNSTSSEDGKSSSGNPPQIYPWMKRAHLGQSEYLISKLLLRVGKKSICLNNTRGKNWCEQRERERRGWIESSLGETSFDSCSFHIKSQFDV